MHYFICWAVNGIEYYAVIRGNKLLTLLMIQLKVVGPGTRLWGTPRWYPRLGWGTSIICVRYKTNIIKDMDTCLYFPADTRSAKCIHYHHFSKSFHFLSQLFSCLIAWTDCSSSKRIVHQSQDLRWLPQIPSPWGNFESVHGLNLCASKTPLSSNLSFMYFSTFLFLLQSKTNVGKHKRQQMLECWAKNKSAGGTQHIGQPQWGGKWIVDGFWILTQNRLSISLYRYYITRWVLPANCFFTQDFESWWQGNQHALEGRTVMSVFGWCC